MIDHSEIRRFDGFVRNLTHAFPQSMDVVQPHLLTALNTDKRVSF